MTDSTRAFLGQHSRMAGLCWHAMCVCVPLVGLDWNDSLPLSKALPALPGLPSRSPCASWATNNMSVKAWQLLEKHFLRSELQIFLLHMRHSQLENARGSFRMFQVAHAFGSTLGCKGMGSCSGGVRVERGVTVS